MADTVQTELLVNRDLPAIVTADGVYTKQRGNRYGEAITQPFNPVAAAIEGSYFVMRNPTPGTGVAHTADPTAVGATDAVFLLVKNTDTTKHVILDYLWLKNTAAGTGGTIQQLVVTTDDGSVVRYGSAGVANTPVVAGPYGTSSAAAVTAYHGDIVSVANSAEVKIFHKVIRAVIPVAGDVYTFNFNGGGQRGPQANVATDGTGILVAHYDAAPVVLAPSCWLTVQIVRASQSAAASWEFEMGFYQR